MVSKLGYDSYVKRLNSAMVAAILVGAASLLPTALAQTPAEDAKPFVITVNSDASPIS